MRTSFWNSCDNPRPGCAYGVRDQTHLQPDPRERTCRNCVKPLAPKGGPPGVPGYFIPAPQAARTAADALRAQARPAPAPLAANASSIATARGNTGTVYQSRGSVEPSNSGSRSSSPVPSQASGKTKSTLGSIGGTPARFPEEDGPCYTDEPRPIPGPERNVGPVEKLAQVAEAKPKYPVEYGKAAQGNPRWLADEWIYEWAQKIQGP